MKYEGQSLLHNCLIQICIFLGYAYAFGGKNQCLQEDADDDSHSNLQGRKQLRRCHNTTRTFDEFMADFGLNFRKSVQVF